MAEPGARSGGPAALRIAPATTVGAVDLTVADLDGSVAYYERAIGLRVRERTDGLARLGAGAGDLLVLHEQAGARPVHGHAGLFHFALRVPAREDLGRWLAHAVRDRVTLAGASDHLVSEALYLRDPDHHGIEIYRDRPRDVWPRDGARIRMATLPLDLEDLAASGGAPDPGWEGLAAGTVMGHVHLHVADIADTERFYSGVLGLDVSAHLGDEATFLSAGGYHHHVGGNVWAGRGVTQPPPGSARLRHFTLVLPDAAERDRVAGRVADSGQAPLPVGDALRVLDPAGNALHLTAAASEQAA
jgi:catechol 2,3-dioxygenase